MRRAVVVPGRRFRPWSPLLMFAGLAAEQRGAELRALSWDESELVAAEAADARPAEWVGWRVDAALDGADGADAVVIGKSMASYAAATVAAAPCLRCG